MLQRSPLVIIFMTVFIYLVGFGMIIPVLPALSRVYGATAFEVGLVMATYSFFQFLFSPIWGKLSDRYGRRPILLSCLFAEVFIYLGLAYASSLNELIFFRSLAGVFGGSISTASAYVADVTDKASRSKGMGMIGAAFGLGFVLGPLIGGVLIGVGNSLGETAPFGLSFPALVVAAVCLVTFVFAYFRLDEPAKKKQRGSRFQIFKEVIQKPVSLGMLVCFFLTSFALANIEPTLFLLVFDRFQWTGETASYAFGYVGIVMAFTQGYLLRKLLPKIGEPRLMIVGTSALTLGFVLIAIAYSLFPLWLGVTLVSLGLGLSNPSILGALSATVSDDIQGEVFGVTQSLSALGRILGPLAGSAMYGAWGQNSPFYFAAVLAASAFLLILFFLSRIPRLAK